ncbi:MAG: hypothetical protein ACR2NH_00035, partial [Solirubrobacteraceae bacterium]
VERAPRSRELGDFGALHLDSRGCERRADGGKAGWLAGDLEEVLVGADVLGAGIAGDHQVVL